MNTKQAITRVKETITSLDDQKFEDVATILEIGAGNIFLGDETGDSKRNHAVMELVDAVAYSTSDEKDEYQPEAEFVPCYAGSWELVLATLVIEEAWEKIHETALELRKESVTDR